MNFIKLNQNEKPVLVNLDNVTDIHDRGTEVGCSIFFSENARIEVDETLEQIQNLIKYINYGDA